MKARDALLAIVVGLAIFGIIEFTGANLGIRTAITASIWLDALVYAISALTVRWMLSPLFRRARGGAILGGSLLFVVLFALVTGLLGGIADLTADGGWGTPSLLRGAFTVTPINVLLTFAVELWFAAVPAAFAGGLFLFAATGGAGRR